MAEARSDHSDRGRADRIERLRKRLQRAADENHPTQRDIIATLKGVLDLLADEL